MELLHCAAPIDLLNLFFRGVIVPKKLPNKDGHCSSAEAVEGRRPTEGNTLPSAAPRTQCRTGASIGLQRVREAATLLRQAPEVRAVCGSSARTDLRGGPPARAVPTATRRYARNHRVAQTHLLTFRCRGRGDRRRQAGLTAFREMGPFSTMSRNTDEITRLQYAPGRNGCVLLYRALSTCIVRLACCAPNAVSRITIELPSPST